MCAAELAVLFLCPAVVTAQPVFVETAAQFGAAPPAAIGFQTRIVRASLRDHLRDYRVRVLQDGLAVQKRFTFGR
jgi:hypothetical protein